MGLIYKPHRKNFKWGRKLGEDNFQRANETPLASPWLRIGNGVSTFNLTNNQVVYGIDTQDADYYYSGVAWPANQYSQVRLIASGNVGVGVGPGVALRGNDSSANRQFYRIVVSDYVDGTNGTAPIEIAKFLNGVWSLVAVRYAGEWRNGDMLRGEIIGSTIRVYRNGIQVGTDVTDSSITSGRAGITYSSTLVNSAILSWEGGEMPAN
jgi:hypothetical protein